MLVDAGQTRKHADHGHIAHNWRHELRRVVGWAHGHLSSLAGNCLHYISVHLYSHWFDTLEYGSCKVQLLSQLCCIHYVPLVTTAWSPRA